MSMSHIVGDKAFRDKLFQLALPIALQSLLVASVSAADAFMLGRFEQNSMAAVSLATQVQFVMTMFIGAVTMGGTVLGAQYYGKILEKTQKQVPSQDEALPTEQIDPGRALDHIFNIMMRGMILIDVLFWAACLFVPRLLMLFFTGDPELIRIGCRYLKIAGWSYLLVGFSQAYHAIMKISEHARMSLYVSIAAVLINIVLNAVLIFGLIGFPRLGAAGAAIATVISRAVELVWCIAVSYRKTYLHPQFRHLFLRNKLLSRDFFRLSLPVLGASLLWGVGFTSYTAIVGHLGADAAAAMSIAAVVRDLICCLCNGIASGGSILLGNELGAGNMERGKQYGIWLRNTSFLIGFLSTGIMLFKGQKYRLSFDCTVPDTASVNYRIQANHDSYKAYMSGKAAPDSTGHFETEFTADTDDANCALVLEFKGSGTVKVEHLSLAALASETLMGDVNMDGEFNISDIVVFQKWLLAKPDTELKNWKAADLCGDGRLDVFDLCLMRRKLIIR